MDAKIILHATGKEEWFWDIVDVKHDINGRTVTMTNLFGETKVVNLKKYDLMILAK